MENNNITVFWLSYYKIYAIPHFIWFARIPIYTSIDSIAMMAIVIISKYYVAPREKCDTAKTFKRINLWSKIVVR